MSRMNTFSGKKFDPMDIKAEDICLEDIAHALSLLCRGGGHLKHFYSVGQHSINCMKEARERGWSERVQAACLFHDASEAYMSDIIRPIKMYLSNYLDIEKKMMDKIWERFGLYPLNARENEKWKLIDDEILSYELRELMNGDQDTEAKGLYSCPDTAEKHWKAVEAEFMQMAASLCCLKSLL